MIEEEISAQIWSAISASRRILLHCHPGPDQDSVGGVLAMAEVLNSLGKEVTIIWGDSEPHKSLLNLPGASQIIAKNFFEINQSDYDLFIIQDSGSLNQISKKGEIFFDPGLMTIVIDHHTSNPAFGKINLIDPQAPATCQILYELFVLWGVPITHEMALCLFAGIHADTGGFRHATTNIRSFEIAAELVKKAPDFSNLLYAIENSNERGNIVFEALALNAVESFFDDQVVISTVTNEMLQANKLKNGHIGTSGISTKLRTVENWVIAACMVEKEPNEIMVSLRSDGKKFDVSQIAKRIGGGGHKAASGIFLKTDPKAAKEVLLAAIAAEYPNLGQP